DFSNRSNAFATVMVGPFSYRPPAKAVDVNQDDGVTETGETGVTETGTPGPTEAETIHSRTFIAGRRNIRIGQWQIKARKIDLEIWDEQVEDGDIISIEVNGAVVVDQATVATNA